jgi:hypothetical protein
LVAGSLSLFEDQDGFLASVRFGDGGWNHRSRVERVCVIRCPIERFQQLSVVAQTTGKFFRSAWAAFAVVLGEMPLFAVFALKESGPAIDEAVSKVPSGDTFKIEPGKWVVDSEVTTAKELSLKLGLKETHTHIILNFRGYYGRAQPDLWEWIAAKKGKADA